MPIEGVFGLEFGGEQFGNKGRGGNGGNRSGLPFTALHGLGGFGRVGSRIGHNAFLNRESQKLGAEASEQ